MMLNFVSTEQLTYGMLHFTRVVYRCYVKAGELHPQPQLQNRNRLVLYGQTACKARVLIFQISFLTTSYLPHLKFQNRYNETS